MLNYRVIAFATVTMILTQIACAADPPPLLTKIPAPPMPADAANPITADVNSDKRDDLLIPAAKALHILLSNGDGTFTPSAASPLALPMAANESLTADFNADGHADLALAHHDSYDVAILLGDGAGNFTTPPGSPFSAKPTGNKPHTHGLAAGEFNRDGKLDLVVGNDNDADISMLLGDGTGTFAVAPRSPFPCGRGPYPIATADFDADRNSDVIVPNSAPGVNTVTSLMGTGDAALTPAPWSPIKIPAGAFFAAAADITGDSKPDAVITHTEGDDRATILINDGRGQLTPAPSSPFTIGHNAWCVALADMNRDGQADLTFAADTAIRIFPGDGTGKFTPPPAPRSRRRRAPGGYASPTSTPMANATSSRGAWMRRSWW